MLETDLLALLTNAPDLTAAIGRPYSTVMAEVWSLPDDVQYPLLAIAVDDMRGSVPLALSTMFSEPRLRCWFLSETFRREVTVFAEALKAKLNMQQVSLLAAGSLFANQVEWVLTRITHDAQIDKHQSYVEFKLIA